LGDRLSEIFSRQEKFTANFIHPRVAGVGTKRAYSKQMVLGMLSELDELLRATGNWKGHRYGAISELPRGVLEECVDIFKYLLNILLTYGYGSDDLFAGFHEKSLVVEERFRWEKNLEALGSLDNVVAVDLDGVLAAYPENWIEFLNEFGKLPAILSLEDFSFSSVPLPSIPRHEYMKLKHRFREEGYESAKVEPTESASLFTNNLRLNGFKVVILSARPCHKYKRIMTDTIMWLQEHDFHYDAVLWDAEKHIRIIEQFPTLRFMVEDHPRIALEVASLGYKVYLVDRPYNQDVKHPNISRVSSLMDINKGQECCID